MIPSSQGESITKLPSSPLTAPLTKAESPRVRSTTFTKAKGSPLVFSIFPLIFCAIIGAKDISDISVAITTLIIIAIFATKRIICSIKMTRTLVWVYTNSIHPSSCSLILWSLKIQQHTYCMCQQSLLEVQSVTHTVALCLQVALVVLVGYHFDGHVLHNLESVRL